MKSRNVWRKSESGNASNYGVKCSKTVSFNGGPKPKIQGSSGFVKKSNTNLRKVLSLFSLPALKQDRNAPRKAW